MPVLYTNVPPSVLLNKNTLVPPTLGPSLQIATLPNVLPGEYGWLEHLGEVFGKADLKKDDCLTWSAYHAALQPPPRDPTTNIALMPLFLECAQSVSMIQHSMNVVKVAVEHLNPGQIPVLIMDQPLFSIAKAIQWNFPNTHGEDKYLIMFGGLRIEM